LQRLVLKKKLLYILFLFLPLLLVSDPLVQVDEKYADYIKNTKKIDLNAAKERLRQVVGKEAVFPFKKPKVVVYKSKLRLELYDGEKLIKSYKVGIGQNPVGHKMMKGDLKTPVGQYYIVTKNPLSQWHMFMGISYPNSEDAKKAMEDGRINKEQYNRIVSSEKRKAPPPWNTPIGGAVGIHGPYNDDNWTWGCVGMLPDDLDEIWVSIKYWTPVKIYP